MIPLDNPGTTKSTSRLWLPLRRFPKISDSLSLTTLDAKEPFLALQHPFLISIYPIETNRDLQFVPANKKQHKGQLNTDFLWLPPASKIRNSALTN